MKLHRFVSFLLASATATLSHAALFTYDFSDVTTSSTSSSGGVASNLTFSSFTPNGVGAASTVAGVFSFSGWTTGATSGSDTFSGAFNSGDFFEFTITPDPNFQFTLSSLDFSAGRSSTGTRQFAVRSSVDGFGANLAPSVTDANESVVPTNIVQFTDNSATATYTGNSINLPGGAFSNSTGPITFRLYAFNAESAAGTFRIDNFAINGSVATLPSSGGNSAVPDSAINPTMLGSLLLLIAISRHLQRYSLAA